MADDQNLTGGATFGGAQPQSFTPPQPAFSAPTGAQPVGGQPTGGQPVVQQPMAQQPVAAQPMTQQTQQTTQQEPPRFDPATGAPMNAAAQAVIAARMAQQQAQQEPPKFDPTTGAPLNAAAQALMQQQMGGAAAGAAPIDDTAGNLGRPIGSFGIAGEFQTKVKIPAHTLKFDENNFLRLLAGSISLSKDEKKRIIQAVPKLSQFQVDELIRIFEEEKSKFSDLDAKHEEQLRILESKHRAEWDAIELEYAQQGAAKQDEDQAAALRAQLGLNS